jgi:hypothetical protein
LKNVKDSIEFVNLTNSIKEPIESFVDNTAKLLNESPKSIYRSLEIANNIIPEVKERIANTDLAEKKTELLKLSFC